MDDTIDTTDTLSATTEAFEVLYGTTEDDATTGLIAAFSKLIADTGTVNLELLDTIIVAGTDDDQQVAVAFEIIVGYEPPFEHAESVTAIAVSQPDGPTETSDTDDIDIDLAPDLQDATEAVVTFHPQLWKNDYAVTGTDTETYTCRSRTSCWTTVRCRTFPKEPRRLRGTRTHPNVLATGKGRSSSPSTKFGDGSLGVGGAGGPGRADKAAVRLSSGCGARQLRALRQAVSIYHFSREEDIPEVCFLAPVLAVEF
jgi:hypothetical protein